LRPTALRVRLVAGLFLFSAFAAASCGGGDSSTEGQEEILATLKEIAATQKAMNDRLVSAASSIEGLYARGVMVIPPTKHWADKSGFLIPTMNSPSKGPRDAPIRVVEFADFECPYCRASAGIGDTLMKEFPDQVQFVFKHYPLRRKHKNAEAAARASIAAAKQNRFWPMHDRIFATGQVEPEDLRAHAEAIGLDLEAFDKMRESIVSGNVMNRDRALARDVGAQGTPAFFVNGKKVDEPTQDAVMRAVRSELELLTNRGELETTEKPQAATPEASRAPAAVPAAEPPAPAS
jgi:protein-disulfide isomerase